MTGDLQNQLYRSYPEIFSQKDMDMTDSCMYWGIDVGDGWYDLMDELCSSLQDYSDKMNIQVVATQVKEKFGELRFYYDIHYKENFNNGLSLNERNNLIDVIDKEVEKIISNAEYRSENECEKCGKQYHIKSINGWMMNICEECGNKKKRKLK